MNSVKCPQCSLVNFASQERCKRCGHTFVQKNGLSTVEVKKPSFIARIFGEVSEEITENAYREIQNLLATMYISHISPEIIRAILAKYGVTFKGSKPHFLKLFSKVLQHFANDQKITDEEAHQIQHLQTIFEISDQELAYLQKNTIAPVFENAVKARLSQSIIEPETKDKLDELAKQLRIPQEIADDIYRRYAQPLYQQAVDDALKDLRLSPEEERNLANLARNLSIAPTSDDSSKIALEKFRYYWRVSQGDLPAVDVPIRLRDGELCAMYLPAHHYEMRRKGRAVRYGGVGASVKIIGSLRYRSGYMNRDYITQDVMTYIDSGTLYLTDQRLLFNGNNKTTNVPLNKIINYTLYDDGLVVEKDSGKNQIYKLEYDRGMFSAILDGLLSGQAYKKYRSEEPERYSSQRASTKKPPRAKQEKAAPKNRANKRSPYEVLEVEVGATIEEINFAYRRMAKMYHPDRVSGLGPEFQEIADKKMKEINAAYEVLKKNFS
jgi:hypothetical protein